jgi:hypothetical protein
MKGFMTLTPVLAKAVANLKRLRSKNGAITWKRWILSSICGREILVLLKSPNFGDRQTDTIIILGFALHNVLTPQLTSPNVKQRNIM